MEEFAESLASNEVASEAAWVAEPGLVLCFFTFLGKDLTPWSFGATTDTLMQALATLTALALLGAALRKVKASIELGIARCESNSSQGHEALL
jgi:hypothetical protein